MSKVTKQNRDSIYKIARKLILIFFTTKSERIRKKQYKRMYELTGWEDFKHYTWKDKSI